jgi:hypothetical protein
VLRLDECESWSPVLTQLLALLRLRAAFILRAFRRSFDRLRVDVLILVLAFMPSCSNCGIKVILLRLGLALDRLR